MIVVEYIVYETATSTYDPIAGLKVAHPVAHYDNKNDMFSAWLNEFFDGTHNFFVIMNDEAIHV